jgi:hypothetical protein
MTPTTKAEAMTRLTELKELERELFTQCPARYRELVACCWEQLVIEVDWFGHKPHHLYESGLAYFRRRGKPFNYYDWLESRDNLVDRSGCSVEASN